MGLMLDSSVAIASERRGLAAVDMLASIRASAGRVEIALSAVTVMELEHGIWRAKDTARANLRTQFLEDLIGNIPVYPSQQSWLEKRVESTPNSGRKASKSLSRIC